MLKTHISYKNTVMSVKVNIWERNSKNKMMVPWVETCRLRFLSYVTRGAKSHVTISTVNHFETFKAGRVNLTVVLNTDYSQTSKSLLHLN